MRKMNMLLGLVLVPLALTGCESTHPLAQMGPQSARYITANYRQSFREALASEARSTAASDAAATRPATPATSAGDSGFGPVGAARSTAMAADPATASDETEVELVEEAPPEAPTAVAVERRLPGRQRQPVGAPVPPRSAVAAAGARAAKPAGLPEPLRWARRDYAELGSHTPAPPVTQRRFVRLRLTELDGTPVRARDVRPVLRAIAGVQDAVLNETTGTAVVVVSPGIEAQTIIEELAGRFRATAVR